MTDATLPGLHLWPSSVLSRFSRLVNRWAVRLVGAATTASGGHRPDPEEWDRIREQQRNAATRKDRAQGLVMSADQAIDEVRSRISKAPGNVFDDAVFGGYGDRHSGRRRQR